MKILGYIAVFTFAVGGISPSMAQGIDASAPQQTLQTQSPDINDIDIGLAAIIHNAAPPTEQDYRLNEKTLAHLNTPMVQTDGMWPPEKRAMQYITPLFDDIENSTGADRSDKIKKARTRISDMIDANLVHLSTPDDIGLRIGLTQSTIDQNKAALTATNTRLKTALKMLK